jgi:hypothetical protein
VISHQVIASAFNAVSTARDRICAGGLRFAEALVNNMLNAGLARRPRLAITTIRRILSATGYLALAVQVLLVALRVHHYQWDFRAYYFAADLAMAGSDPYNPHALGQAIEAAGLTDGKVMPFIYPPHMLLEFAPFTLVPFPAAYYVYLAVKVIALVVVVAVGASWLDGWWRASWPLLVVLMFTGAVGADLRAGNLGLLESAFVLLAIVELTRRRPGVFGALVAAASSWKLALVPIAPLAFAVRSRSAIRGVFIPVATIGSLLMLDRLVRPDLWDKFGGTSSGLFEDLQMGSLRGYLNSSSLRMISDVSYLTFGRLEPIFVMSIYAVASMAVLGVTVLTAYRKPHAPILPVCLYGLLAYGLIVPRLTSYSFVLLLVPSVYAMSKCMRPSIGIAAAAFSCVPFFYIGRLIGRSDQEPASTFFLLLLEYSNLLVIGVCWIAMTYVFIRKRSVFEDLINTHEREMTDPAGLIGKDAGVGCSSYGKGRVRLGRDRVRHVVGSD